MSGLIGNDGNLHYTGELVRENIDKQDLLDFIDAEINRERDYLSDLIKGNNGNSYDAGNSVGIIYGLQLVRDYIMEEEQL